MVSAYLGRCAALWKTIEMNVGCQEVSCTLKIERNWKGKTKSVSLGQGVSDSPTVLFLYFLTYHKMSLRN